MAPLHREVYRITENMLESPKALDTSESSDNSKDVTMGNQQG
jgi:hypothetical protein